MATQKSEASKSDLEEYLSGFQKLTDQICDNAEHLLAGEEQVKFLPAYRRAFADTTRSLKEEVLAIYASQDQPEKDMADRVLRAYGGVGMIEESLKIIGKNRIQERRAGIFGLIGQILEKLKELIRDLFPGLGRFLNGLLDFIDNIFEMIAGLFSARDRQDAFQVRKNALEIRLIRERGYIDLAG